MTPVFTKQHGDSVISDSRRLRILADICQQTDGVVTPTVLQVDRSRGLIDYQYLDLSNPLTRRIGETDPFWKAGLILSGMHAAAFDYSPDEFRTDPFPLQLLGVSKCDADMLSEALPPGWFHSDFWHGNIFFLHDDILVVIDPLPASFLFPDRFILASGAVDVVTMYMSLIAVHPLIRQITLPLKSRITSAGAFLEAYLHGRGIGVRDVADAVRRAADAFAFEWIGKSSQRLAWPVHRIKKAALQKVMKRMRTARRRRDCELLP